jgi:hypothetical protein
VLADLGAHPIGRVRDETTLALRVETRRCFEKAEVALLHDVLHRNAPAAVFARDHQDEREAGLDEPIARAAIACAVAAGELAFFVGANLRAARDGLAVRDQ